MKIFKQLMLGSLLVLQSILANAMVVDIEQSPLDGGDGYYSNASAGAFNAENFTFTTDVLLTSVTWWGSYEGLQSLPELFGVEIYSNLTGLPIFSAPFSGSGTDSGLVDLFGGTVYEYTLSLAAPLSLTGNMEYYLSVFNDDINADDWYWQESLDGDNLSWYQDVNFDWVADPNSLNLAFRLNAETIAQIPEPSPMALLLLPLLWLVRKSLITGNKNF